VAQTIIGRQRAENDGDAAAVELAQAGEEGVGEGGVVVKGVPVEDYCVAVVNGPVLREHDPGFFFVCDQRDEMVVEVGLGVDEDQACPRGVVADTNAR
jgi:hypothetical protein